MLTDGVLAIVMTLLVLDIRLPAAPPQNILHWSDLSAVSGQLFSYALSFWVIALFWLNHAQRFRHLKRMTFVLFALNTLFLMAVGLLPFTTSLLASTHGGDATAIYASAMAFASLMLGLMDLHVTTAGLTHAEDGKGERLKPIDAWQFLSAFVFLASIPLSLWSADWAQRSWILLIPIAFIPDRHRAELRASRRAAVVSKALEPPGETPG